MAVEACENELRNSWHLAKTNHAGWVERKKGVDMLRSKLEALLTSEDAWV